MKINNLYKSINNLHIFTKTYNYNDLLKIDYTCENLNGDEKKFININYNGNNEIYKKELLLFNLRCMKYFNEDLNKLKINKFYFNNAYILSEQEQINSLIIGYILSGEINIRDREIFGYVLKLTLNEYDFNIFRNVLSVFYDGLDYNDFIRGKRQLLDNTFDEDMYDYVTKIVTNPNYDYKNDNIKIEDFEEKYYSKYDEIQKIIKINNLD